MPRVYSYYGNNRLQEQTNARTIYNNNINGKRLINNPQTSNYNSSNFNMYHSGSQTTYQKGIGSDLTGQRYVVSVGGIVNIPVVPEPPQCPTKIVSGGTFTTNEELETLRGCTVIYGNLEIIKFIGQPNFSVFDCLITINGWIRIQQNTELTTISGFPSLILITDEIRFTDNASLTTISGFTSLTTLYAIAIYTNINLINMSGFTSIVSKNQSYFLNNATSTNMCISTYDKLSIGRLITDNPSRIIKIEC